MSSFTVETSPADHFAWQLVLKLAIAKKLGKCGFADIAQGLGPLLQAQECVIYSAKRIGNFSAPTFSVDDRLARMFGVYLEKSLSQSGNAAIGDVLPIRREKFLMTTRREVSKNYTVIAITRSAFAADFNRHDETMIVAVHTLLPSLNAEAEDVRSDRLGPRAREIFEFLKTGCSEKEIAKLLDVSVHTVHVHVKRIYTLFGVHSRAELMGRILKGRSQ